MNLPAVLTAFIGTILAPLGDIYVDQAAVNCATGTGTAIDPVCAITAAIALASPGDTIHIAPGTYVGGIVLPFDLELTGTSGQVLTILDGQDLASVVTVPVGVTATIDGLTLRNGRGPLRGGGVMVAGDATLRNSTITQNTTLGYIGLYGGAGVAALDGGSTVVIDRCSIFGNYSDSLGGGIAVAGADLTITSSLVLNNRVWADAYPGGGIYAAASHVTITNSTVSGNRAYGGGGLYVLNSLAGSGMWSSTVSDNFDSYGGVFSQGTPFEMGNTLVAENFYDPGYPSPDVSGQITSAGHNLIGKGGAGFVNGVDGDLVGSPGTPLSSGIGPLADNGGPTMTHALLVGSPAIDAADALTSPLLDQRGFPRPFGSASDIGAYEGVDPGPSFCNGDGGDQMGCTNCPCGNNSAPGTIGGCLNSAGVSGRLTSSGSNSVSLPIGATNDLRFGFSGGPANTLCVLLSADALAPTGGLNPCFGIGSGIQASALDGLRCAVFNLRRHGGRPVDTNGEVGVTNDPWGGEGEPSAGLAVAFGGFVAGDTRYFQAIYRVDLLTMCMRGLNTTQAIEVTFTP